MPKPAGNLDRVLYVRMGAELADALTAEVDHARAGTPGLRCAPGFNPSMADVARALLWAGIDQARLVRSEARRGARTKGKR